MRDDRPTIDGAREHVAGVRRQAREVPALVLAWSREQPERAGEVALIEGEQILGRGGARPEDVLPRAQFVQQRPGQATLTGPLDSLRVSRAQLRLAPRGDALRVESIGRCPLLVNGERVDGAEVQPGDTVQLDHELVFLVARRPERIPELRSLRLGDELRFGAADRFGLVGETPAAWALRDQLAFAAHAEGHVLVRGESGTGKELCAAAIHGLSPRGERPLVARNAATFPAGLVDAELFGNAKNYPNPGVAERDGLIGEADGTTLFLDEIGELPAALQAHLLRVLDRHGEYQRLGEARLRHADLRVVAATNRAVAELKHDFAARFLLRVEVPPLSARAADVPLLIRHLLARMAGGNDEVRRRFCDASRGASERRSREDQDDQREREALAPRVAPALVDRLLRHRFPTNTRGLAQILWQAVAESRGDTVELTPGVVDQLAQAAPDRAATAEVGRAQIEAALAAAQGNVTRAARALGFKNRFALYRVMKKLGVEAGDTGE
ncbi:MAG TPA: sigma 54-interacting transcriptional regulator [Kofleriaceae bacterium]|jgi:two-component system nitrogen regulation response regulator GlnG/two-component system response regulator HydG|nr:sigma 54-interacting transcriptional regulator [Kofleriaceae bacterium]